MMTILHSFETWHQYISSMSFHINIDQHSLKYFPKQRLCSPRKHKWVTKMLGHDYEIIYNKGREHVVFYALSSKF